jgi:hypothetical protein
MFCADAKWLMEEGTNPYIDILEGIHLLDLLERKE